MAGIVRLLLRHVLPKGNRRVRDFDFRQSNAKPLLSLLQCVLKVVIEEEAVPTCGRSCARAVMCR